MEKKIYLLLALTLAYSWVESAPGHLDESELDPLSFDESYVNKDINNFIKFLEDTSSSENIDTSKTDNFKPKSFFSGFRNKFQDNEEVNTKHNIEDLKKVFKIDGLHDEGTYDNDTSYILGKGISSKAVGITGNEDRKYKQGTKTRGFHRVEHKDEYKKDKEFYEDDETSGVIRKIGAKGRAFGVAAGAGRSNYHFHNDRNKELNGKQAYLDRGNSDKQLKENIDSQGFDAYFYTN